MESWLVVLVAIIFVVILAAYFLVLTKPKWLIRLTADNKAIISNMKQLARGESLTVRSATDGGLFNSSAEQIAYESFNHSWSPPAPESTRIS